MVRPPACYQRKKEKKKQTTGQHSHTAACTWIKPRRQIPTWDWLNLQNKKVKKERKKRKKKQNETRAKKSLI